MDTRATSAATSARVTLLAFARVRELLGTDRLVVDVLPGTTVAALWNVILERAPELASLQHSTRVARNGRIASLNAVVEDGDELAFLPPVGGG